MKRESTDLSHPEEYFSALSLRRGIKLFAGGHVTLTRRTGEISYSAGKRVMHEGAFLPVKNGLIASAPCTCGKSRCEHLAAAVFALEPERYQHAVARQDTDSAENAFKQIKEKASALGEAEILGLLDKPGKDGPLLVLSWLRVQLRRHAGSISQTLLMKLFCFLRNRTIDTVLGELVKAALFKSVGTRAALNSQAAIYLLPFVMEQLSGEELARLKAVKRKSAKEGMFGGPDTGTVISAMLQRRRKNATVSPGEAELIAAFLISFKAKSAKSALRELRPGRGDYSSAAAFFGAGWANMLRLENEEIFFLKEILLHETVISAALIQRFAQLTERKKVLGDTLALISHDPDKYCFVLFHARRFNDLISFLKSSPPRFSVIHETILTLLPGQDEALFSVYPRAAVAAMNGAGDGQYRMFIAEKVRDLLRRIDRKARERMVKGILQLLGERHHLASRFRELLNLPA